MRLSLREAAVAVLCLVALSPCFAQTSLPPEVELGRSWLSAQIAADGRLAATSLQLATEPQSEAEVIETLQFLGGAPAALVQRQAARGADVGVEHLARQIIAQARAGKLVGQLLTELRSQQNADGGFGGAVAYQSTVLDTSFALVAFRVAGVAEGQDISRAVNYLVSRVADPASSDWQMSALAKPYVSAYALLALQMHSARFPIAAAVTAQRDALIAQQGNGVYAEVLLDTVAALALQFTTTGGTGLTDLRTAIRAAQAPDGSWQGDSFLTALALRALASEVIAPPSVDGNVVLRVRDGVTLAFLQGVTVTVQELPSLALQTGADGRVDTGPLAAGTYHLALSRDGFRSRDLGAITVSAGQTRDLGLIDLLRDANVAVVFGRVTDVATTNPLAGVDIAVSGAVQASAQTAPDGSFELVFATAGDIQISAGRAGYQTASGTGALVLGQSLRFSPALFADGGQVPTSASLLAMIVDATTELPLSGVSVTVGAATAVSDVAGVVQLTELPAGAFTATLSKVGYLGAQLSGSLVAGVNDAGVIRLQPQNLDTRSTLSGRVADAGNGVPIGGATVAISGTNLRATTATDGRYTIANITGLPFTAVATAPGYGSQQVATGDGQSGNFQADFALTKLAAANVSLDSVTMSAPEFDPFSEVGVLGTVTNLSADSEIGLIFNAIVSDAGGKVIRDVPNVQSTLNRTFDDTIIRFAPGETKPITIIWGDFNDAPGDYAVLFRGTTPDGRVVLEGSTSYRVRTITRLGGSIIIDPPLIQAGTGQSVDLSADLTNVGNQIIPAGDVKLSIKLVAQDDRPPLPPKPTFTGTLISGTPLSRPTGITRDAAGNLYTLNTSPTAQLVKVLPDGTGAVLRALPTVSSTNASLSTPLSVSWRAPNLLRIAWITGWTADLDLDNGNAVSNFKAPPTGIQASSVTAYTFDPANGNEYFGATQSSRPRVLLRDAAGQVSVLVDAGLTSAGKSQFGPDGKLYVVSTSPGAVFRIDPADVSIDAIWVGLTSPQGMAIDASGVIYVASGSPQAVLRRLPDGRVETFATTTGLSFADLKFGRDGLLYGVASDGSIRRFAADGTNTIFARGIINSVSGVAVDDQRGIYAYSGATLRFRSDATGIVSLGNGSQSITSVMPDGAQGPLVANGTSLLRAVGSAYQTLLTPANNAIQKLAPLGADVLIGAQDGSRSTIASSDRANFVPIAASPFASQVRKILAESGQSLLVVNTDSLVRIAPDGAQETITRFGAVQAWALDRSSGDIWINSSTDGLLRIDGVTGTRTRLRNWVSNMQWGLAVDINGTLIFGDASARKLVRFDPATGALTDFQILPSPLSPTEVAIAPDGTLFVRFSDATLRRLDGASWTTIDTSVSELVTSANGQVGYRKTEKLFAAPLTGAAATLLSVMVQTPDLAAWVDNDSFAAYLANQARLRLLTAAGAVTRDVYGFVGFVAIAATASGDILILDSRKDLSLVRGGAISRVGRFTAATDLDTVGDEVLVLTGAGVSRLLANNSLQLLTTVPGWAVNQYGGIGVSGDAMVLFNSTTSEIVLSEAGVVTQRYQPFASPTSLAQQTDGTWLIGSASRIVALSDHADQSRIYSTITGTRDILARRDGSMMVANGTNILQTVDVNGTASPSTGTADTASASIVSLGESPSGIDLFAITSAGVIYRQQGDLLSPFAAGVSQVNTIVARVDGGLLLTSETSPAILQHRDGKTTSVGTLIQGPRTLCELDADTVAAVSANYLSVLDVGGMANFAALPTGVNPRTVACIGDGAMRLLSNTTNRIDRFDAGVQQRGIQVGDVVSEQSLPMSLLDLDGIQHLHFSPWLPPAGGDYEIDLVPLAPGVEGRVLAGIHVGSAAVAVMTVAPDSVPPGEATIQIDTHLEGADFTRLSRVERSQLRVAGNAPGSAAMSMDPAGQLWYISGSGLFRVPAGGSAGVRVGTFAVNSIRGEIPIDSQGRAYYVVTVSGRQDLRRTDGSGSTVRIGDLGAPAVTGMTIDALDRLYVLTSDNRVLQVSPDGVISPYVNLPTDQAPFGITRDGAGGVYVQQRGNRILYISPTRDVQALDLRGAAFEYEGVNIAGDCGESMFMTPFSMPGTSQSGEEHTVVQLVGRTGELGVVLDGKTISQDLLDIDFVTYDRFGSRLLMQSDAIPRLYTIPVTCGAIDMDLHIVLPSGQPVFAMDPVASSVFTRDNGDVEYVWNLRDVNKQGLTISLSSQLRELMRTQDRPVAKEAFVLLKNSFRPEPVRLNIDIPSVHVRDLVDIAVALDREEYPQQSAVAIRVPMNNLDNVDKSGALVVRVEDANGALVDTLVERQQAFGPLETIELTPPFNTGALRVGDYRVVAEIRDALGGLVAQASDDFRVVAGSGSGPTLISAVATDQPVYLVGSAAQILASVENQSGNAGFVGLLVSERVTASNGTVVFDGSLPLTNLEPSAQARLTFALSLAGLSSGFYDVYQEVRSADGALLDNRATRFEVQSIAGTAALTGALALDPLHVRRGNALGIAATLRNRGDAAVSGAESVIRVLLPGSNTALAEWVLPHDLAAGASVDIPASFDTANRDLRDYLVVLSARVNGQEAVLAQKPFWIDDVVFAGELTAAPADVTQGNDVVLSGAVRNIGTLAAPGSDIALRVEDATTGALVREWHVPADVAAGAQQDVSQTLNTLALPIGAYMARLSVTFEGNERPLAQADFVVRNFRIAGTFAATPVQVNRGEPVDLLGTVSNSGNLGIDPLPLRIEVVKVDTLTSVLSLDDSIALAEQGSFPMRRVADTTGFAAGQYEGVFSAFFNGEWHELARDGFEVVRAVEVELHMEVPRDARVLVLMSCSPSEDDHRDDEHDRTAGGTSNHDEDDDDEDEDEDDDSSCAETRQQFLSQYLSERGIEHRIVLDQDSFMDELRCGRYNVFWLSGDSVKLGTAEAIELRESIYRGDGFISDGSHDERNSQLDEMLGVNFRGHHSTQDMGVTGTAALFPAVTVPSYGRALKLELTTGTLEAAFAPVNAPAIVSASYGQGRALTYGFDLIDSLLRDGMQPATERLLLNALVHVAPQSAPASYAIGSYTPVTTTVQNLGVAVDARLETQVDAPTAIVSSSPQATTGDVLGSAWDFNLPEGEHRSFDVNVVTGNTAPAQVRSSVFERAAGGLLPLGNAQIELAASDATAAADVLLASLRSASLRGGEASARNRAVKAIEEARAAEAQDDTEEAIDQWLKASDEVRHIQSVSHAEWRLAIAQLLAVSQHLGCKLAFKLCGTQPTTATAFEASAFVPLQSLGRVQSGGKNAWEWQLGDRGDAAPGLRIDLDWRKKQAVRFVLNVDAAGKGRLELRQGNSVKAVVQTDPAVDGALARGDALQWVVRAGSGHEHARFKLTGFTINGESVAAELESEDDDAASQARLTWYKPAMRAALTLDGVLELEFDDEVPQGAQLELELRAGNLQCNGGTP